MTPLAQERAYLRGVRAAKLWKRLTTVIRRWDCLCVTKARKHNLPAWLGHVPLILSLGVMLLIFVFGGIMIASSVALITAIALLAGGLFSSKEEQAPSSNQSNSEEHETRAYYDWNQDRFNGREYNPHRYNEWKDED